MSAAGAPAVVAIDWGTSSLRVWLMDAGGAVLAERRSGEGMQTAREIGFPVVLERMLSDLAAPAGLPVVACGMVGARQGWMEAPYADIPATLTEIFDRSVAVPDAGRVVRIIPGLAQRDTRNPDVIRGEETQIAGAMGGLGAGRHVLCMPGTHSKWVEVADGRVLRFTTWMTGELFNVLSAHTILAHSIGDAAKRAGEEGEAFGEGLALGLEEADRVTSVAFGIRAATLLHGLQPQAAAARLSGLLLGAEIAGARRLYLSAGEKVVLVASGVLQRLYADALALAGLPVTAVDADEAVRSGLAYAARINGLLPR